VGDGWSGGCGWPRPLGLDKGGLERAGGRGLLAQGDGTQQNGAGECKGARFTIHLQLKKKRLWRELKVIIVVNLKGLLIRVLYPY